VFENQKFATFNDFVAHFGNQKFATFCGFVAYFGNQKFATFIGVVIIFNVAKRNIRQSDGSRGNVEDT